MTSVNEQSVVDCDEVESKEVEEVQIIDEGEKSLGFVPPEGFQGQSEKDRPTTSWKIKPPKNLILVEGDPIDDMGVQKKRQMRSFPSEELLSAKIRMANGTDYSNHFIEQHYNPGSSGRLKKRKKRFERIGVIGLLKTKKLSLDDLGLEFEKKKRNGLIPDPGTQEIIDLTDTTNEVEIVGYKNAEDNSGHKFTKKSDSPAVIPLLVPYSSSEDESGGDSCLSTPLDEDNEILRSRQSFIGEGLNKDEFKFGTGMATADLRAKKFD